MLVKVQQDAPNPRTGKDAAEAAKAIKPPERKPGESLEEYGERLRWFQAREQKDKPDLFDRPIRGYIGTSEGMVPWYKATYLGPSGNSGATDNPEAAEHLNARLNPAYAPETYTFDPLPDIRKRTAQERFDEVSQMLFAVAAQSYEGGVMRLPLSVCQRLVRLGVYKTIEAAQQATPEEVYREWGVYTRALLASA